MPLLWQPFQEGSDVQPHCSDLQERNPELMVLYKAVLKSCYSFNETNMHTDQRPTQSDRTGLTPWAKYYQHRPQRDNETLLLRDGSFGGTQMGRNTQEALTFICGLLP